MKRILMIFSMFMSAAASDAAEFGSLIPNQEYIVYLDEVFSKYETSTPEGTLQVTLPEGMHKIQIAPARSRFGSLIPNHEYEIYVDEVFQTIKMSDGEGSLSVHLPHGMHTIRLNLHKPKDEWHEAIFKIYVEWIEQVF